MALIKRTTKGSPLTFAEGDANLVYLEALALSGSGGSINTGSFATTGSNIFTGNQIISNSTLRLSAGSSIVWTGSATLNDWNYAPLINADSSRILFSPQGVFATSINQIFINMSGSLGIGKMPTASLDVSGTLFVSNGITGSLLGTASFATTASYYNTSTLATTGSNRFSGSQTITGSILGNVTALTISSNTASLNLTSGSFYTLQLVSGSNTFINPTNIRAGQTVSILVSTTGSATVSFPTIVDQPSGSAYVPTTTTGKDVLTFISFDTTNLYLANVKNLI
jgi:hypothetical protein